MKKRIPVFLAAVLLLALVTMTVLRSGSVPTLHAYAAEEWATPAEQSEYRSTPRYAETMAYVARLAKAAPRQVRLETFGQTHEGRDLVAVIVSGDGAFDPAAARKRGRPVVLIQNAIHAGEPDGKDASLALLRDMVVTRSLAHLMERAVLVVIPIYNADGHERFGPHTRINQNGPQESGWRANARNLNLNRDYMKADTPEARAFLRLWNRWLPDYFVDNHVTDGADYQYDTTYIVSSGPHVVPALDHWQKQTLIPELERRLAEAGHVAGPYLTLVDWADPALGMRLEQTLPRFSDGYVLLHNRIGMTVEMHMLKDYRTRVRGNYELMRGLLEVVNRDAERLLSMNRAADQATIAAGRRYDSEARFPLRLAASGATEPFLYRGYKWRRSASEVSGAMRIEYTDEPFEITIPRQSELQVTRAVTPPLAYLVPPQWTSVIDVLEAHGLELQRTTAPWAAEVELYRCQTPRWAERPFEGRHQAFWSSRPPADLQPQETAPQPPCRLVREHMQFPAGSVLVPMAQRAAPVAIHWLEPEGPDSALAWGHFNPIFEQKEYAEAWVLERLAREMLRDDAALKQEFERRLAADRAFAGSPSARLRFFYERSPWWDARIGLYPVARLHSLEGVPVKP